LYEHLYGYRSGLNEMMCRHLQEYNRELCAMVHGGLKHGSWVLDIGSNDATFLKFYGEGVEGLGLRRVGCDPTGKQFASCYEGVEGLELVDTYFTKEALVGVYGPNVKFRAVSSISMFYDLPDPVQFARDIYDLLEEDGVWTLEQSYVATMLERNSIDTICHEHLEYYGVRQIKEIMDRAGFKIIKLGLNECNGGSFRIYVAKRGCGLYKEDVESVRRFLEQEELHGIHTLEAYKSFNIRCMAQAQRLKTRMVQALAEWQAQGRVPTRLISSDLLRAQQTAHPVAEVLGHTCILNAGLREQCYGVFEGMRSPDIQAQHPEAWQRWLAFDADEAVEGAETTRAFHDRVIATLQDLAQQYAGEHVVVVTHGGVLDMVWRHAQALSLSGPRVCDIPNAGLNQVAWRDGGLHIQLWADAAHLADLPDQPVYSQQRLLEVREQLAAQTHANGVA
jgi:probable phosphoglycerate mutase